MDHVFPIQCTPKIIKDLHDLNPKFFAECLSLALSRDQVCELVEIISPDYLPQNSLLTAEDKEKLRKEIESSSIIEPGQKAAMIYELNAELVEDKAYWVGRIEQMKIMTGNVLTNLSGYIADQVSEIRAQWEVQKLTSNGANFETPNAKDSISSFVDEMQGIKAQIVKIVEQNSKSTPRQVFTRALEAIPQRYGSKPLLNKETAELIAKKPATSSSSSSSEEFDWSYETLMNLMSQLTINSVDIMVFAFLLTVGFEREIADCISACWPIYYEEVIEKLTMATNMAEFNVRVCELNTKVKKELNFYKNKAAQSFQTINNEEKKMTT